MQSWRLHSLTMSKFEYCILNMQKLFHVMFTVFRPKKVQLHGADQCWMHDINIQYQQLKSLSR